MFETQIVKQASYSFTEPNAENSKSVQNLNIQLTVTRDKEKEQTNKTERLEPQKLFCVKNKNET